MATGDRPDQFKRLKSLLPNWFGDQHPVLDALLSGYAYVQAFIFDLIVFARLQTRILTATGGWLDLISADFFGAALPRQPGQSDSAFRTRIIISLFRERGTRAAVIKVLEDLTGRTPIIFEPFRLQDCGAYRAPTSGYGVAGHYGSALLPYQAFVIAFRPLGSGIPLIAGYGVSTGGYHTPSRAAYASLGDALDGVSDADIYAAIDSVHCEGTIAWTRIVN
jgi:hypothetical protein